MCRYDTERHEDGTEKFRRRQLFAQVNVTGHKAENHFQAADKGCFRRGQSFLTEYLQGKADACRKDGAIGQGPSDGADDVDSQGLTDNEHGDEIEEAADDELADSQPQTVIITDEDGNGNNMKGPKEYTCQGNGIAQIDIFKAAAVNGKKICSRHGNGTADEMCQAQGIAEVNSGNGNADDIKG